LRLPVQHYAMQQRNILNTCVTRAKKVLVLAGAYYAPVEQRVRS
jgi:hypothetical protein